MHSLIITSLTGILLLLPVLGIQLAMSQVALALAIAVAFVGLPHGALDHRVGKKVLRSLSPTSSSLVFFCSYLLVALLVVTGWYVSPLLTIVGFFCLSAWHFGLEEDEREIRSRWHWAAMVARGGMVIWVPCVFQGEQISELLVTILPSEDTFAAAQVVALVQFVAPLLVGLTLFDAFSYANDRQPVKVGLSPEWQHRIRLVGFAILFATASPLVSFGVYFCGWHSIRGLIHLHQQFGGPIGRFSLSLLPITGAALALFGIGFAISPNFGQLTPAIIQTVFIGLSAVAIPHLLLHVVSDSLAARPKIAGVPA